MTLRQALELLELRAPHSRAGTGSARFVAAPSIDLTTSSSFDAFAAISAKASTSRPAVGHVAKADRRCQALGLAGRPRVLVVEVCGWSTRNPMSLRDRSCLLRSVTRWSAPISR